MDAPERSQDEEYRELCLAAGYLILSFARLETTLSSILRVNLSNRLPLIGNDEFDVGIPAVLLGSQRFQALKDTINRIISYENVDKNLFSFLQTVWVQVGQIQSLRDVIAHQAMMKPDNGLNGEWEWVGNTTTRDATKTPFYIIHIKNIYKASYDLQSIIERIGIRQTSLNLLHPGLDMTPMTWRINPRC